MLSAKVRAAVYLLRRHARGEVALDTDTLTVLIHHLDQAAVDAARLETHTVVRARPPLPVSRREEALIGLVHCAAQLLPIHRAVFVITRLNRILGRKLEVEVVS